VQNEIFLAPKLLRTLAAGERRLPGVNPLVLNQTLAGDEAFSAVGAPMRPLSSVRSNVNRQLRLLGKHLGAEFALESALRPRSVVQAHVSLQTAQAPQHFAAHSAVDLPEQIGHVESRVPLVFPSSVRLCLVRIQPLFTREVLTALTTFEVE
jgi:hypothetical protein